MSSFRAHGRLALLLAAASLAACASATAAAPAPGEASWVSTRTHAHVPRRAVYAREMGADEALDITVTLKLRNRDLLNQRVLKLTTPGDPEYRHWLKRSQVLADHAPAPDRVAALTDHLARAGFTGIAVADNRLLVTAHGTAAAVRRAFNARMARFERDGRLGIANLTDAQIPAHLDDVVLAVLGLQTLDEMRPLNVRASRVLLTGSVRGLSPTQLPVAYNAAGLPAASTVTVGIITAGNMTQPIADLHQFQTQNGLPALTPTVVTVGRPGRDTSNTPEWDLDSQTIQAMAGGQLAQMIFYTARSLLDSNITAAINRAVSDNAAAIVNVSLGECESAAAADGAMASDDQYFQVAIAQGQTFVVASGDSGSNECAQQGHPAGASYPASSPYVVAVGGTTLYTDTDGSYGGELAWSGSGGSPSTVEPRPAWQAGTVTGAFRGVPDIAFDGDPDSGAIIVVNGGSAQYGGTSLAAPIFVGAYARIQTTNNARLGFPASWIYKYGAQAAAAFHDVTSGSNGGYSAGPGWDFTTGFGSFDVTAAAAFTRPTIDIAASPTNVAPGGTVTLTATVTGNDPSGTVQFLADGISLGAPVPVVGGVATLTTALSATGGSILITARYAGDFYNAGGTSANPVSITIGSAEVPALPPWAAVILAALLLGVAAVRRNPPQAAPRRCGSRGVAPP